MSREARKEVRRNRGNGKLLIVLIILAVILTALIIALNSGLEGAEKGKEEGDKAQRVSTTSLATKKPLRVVIDAGHGGFDGGTKGGTTGVLEAKLNLEIATKLERRLQQLGVDVVMTRADQEAVAETKEGDMAKRREIIQTSGQDMTISIHQNQFEDPSAKGPQVFFNPGSVAGEKLASAIQDAMNDDLEIASPRKQQGKAYYIVKSGSAPAVIVECGFLSNPEEEQLLMNNEYQNRIVEAIINGLDNYLQQTNGGTDDPV